MVSLKVAIEKRKENKINEIKANESSLYIIGTIFKLTINITVYGIVHTKSEEQKFLRIMNNKEVFT